MGTFKETLSPGPDSSAIGSKTGSRSSVRGSPSRSTWTPCAASRTESIFSLRVRRCAGDVQAVFAMARRLSHDSSGVAPCVQLSPPSLQNTKYHRNRPTLGRCCPNLGRLRPIFGRCGSSRHPRRRNCDAGGFGDCAEGPTDPQPTPERARARPLHAARRYCATATASLPSRTRSAISEKAGLCPAFPASLTLLPPTACHMA